MHFLITTIAPAITLALLPALFGAPAHGAPTKRSAELIDPSQLRARDLSSTVIPLEAARTWKPKARREALEEPFVEMRLKEREAEPLADAETNVSLHSLKKRWGGRGCCGAGGW
jgi:hypothetical protein